MAQKSVLTPRQKRSIATKEKIKQTAKQLFTERGYYKVTSNHIAAEAKVPIGSFYNYFGNKKGVLLELIKDFNDAFHHDTLHQFQEGKEELKNASDLLQSLQTQLAETVLSKHLADPFYKIIHSLQFTEPDVLALSEEVRSVEIAHLIKQLEEIHQMCPIKNIPLTAKVIHATAENIGLYVHHLGTSFDKKDLVEKTGEMFSKWLLKIPD